MLGAHPSLRSIGSWLALGSTLAALGACASPISGRVQERALRQSVIDSARRQLTPPGQPSPDVTARRRGVGLNHYPEEVRESIEKRLPELQKMAGPKSYDYSLERLPLGRDLRGREPEVVVVSLEEVLRLAVENNLEVQFARLSPAINEAQVVQGQAAFDWVFFQNMQFQRTDTPVVNRSSQGFNVGGAFRQSDVSSIDIGLRRALTTGGQIEIQQQYSHQESEESGLELNPDPAEQVNVSLQYDQPLLRNFGRNVVMSQVRLAENAERNAIEQLRAELIRIALETEREYWNLVRAHRDLLILERLSQRGQTVFDQIYARRGLDATPAQQFTAASRVEEREGNVIAAQNTLRRTSDRLKSLINDPSLPLANETILLPHESAIDAPIEYNLADAIATAVEHRPEVKQAILSIDDATIRKEVAENARLPRLDLQLRVQLNALEDDVGSAFDTILDRKFIDGLVGIFFEIPIGNRDAEAQNRQRGLERQQATVSFRNTIQQIVLEIRNALDNTMTNYELIGQRRISRIAAAESLRTLLAEKETTAGFTIERLEQELDRQESVANAERNEIQAKVDYNISLAELHAAMGTTLERSRIEFDVPDAEGP